ncbi:MlaE family ABC transporter permease [Candidatus Methylospira mobilis]|nr:ABC transporter permease [Candidatus Methylospira mobilis]
MTSKRTPSGDGMSATGIAIIRNGEQIIIRFSGSWRRDSGAVDSAKLIKDVLSLLPKRIAFQCEVQNDWDSRLPACLFRLLNECRQRNVNADISALPDGLQRLVKQAMTVPERQDARRDGPKTPLLAIIGENVLAAKTNVHEFLGFIGLMLLSLLTLIRGKAKMRRVDLMLFIQEAGGNALPIVTLISILVGLILAFVGSIQLSRFGAQIFIADLVGLGMFREMGALMTAVIVAGRTGAAYAAQLGTMNANSEIDALKTMGISPMEFLVLPRLLALMLMMPLLVLYADYLGVLGGAIVTTGTFDISWLQYINETKRIVRINAFFLGMFKGLVFATLIAVAGCLRGLRCGRSASDVGNATTGAVVDSIVYIVVADSLITIMANRLHI